MEQLKPSAKVVQDKLLELGYTNKVVDTEIWAAAGHPKAVFQLRPQELVKMTRNLCKVTLSKQCMIL